MGPASICMHAPDGTEGSDGRGFHCTSGSFDGATDLLNFLVISLISGPVSKLLPRSQTGGRPLRKIIASELIDDVLAFGRLSRSSASIAARSARRALLESPAGWNHCNSSRTFTHSATLSAILSASSTNLPGISTTRAYHELDGLTKFRRITFQFADGTSPSPARRAVKRQ